jgi:hypothetical protein
MIAPHCFAGAFADADEPLKRIPLRRLTATKVLVDKAANQCGKASTTAARLVAESTILLWF